MFKRILIPTDGSETSRSTLQACVGFAKEIGATVVGLHVLPEFEVFFNEGYMLPEDSREKLKRETESRAEKFLDEISVAAKAAGVNCETLFLAGDYPYEVIIKVAQEKNCDLIAMASHGRKGIKGMLLGSETQKVLTHSQIPVLVYR